MFKKKYFALDYSINYSTACISCGNEFVFKSFIRDKKFTKKELKLLNDLEQTGNFRFIIIPKVENDNILKIKDAEYLANIIIDEIKENNINEIAIEGFAFNSKGSSLSDIYGYQYIIRYLLLKNNINYKLFAPTAIKKTAGKGNYNKLQMVESFINFENNNLNKIKEIYKINKKLIKPLDDIVDSFWCFQTYFKSL